MSDLQTTRPIAPAPNLAAIPTALIARAQWVCWRYELNKAGTKWTKVLYTPQTTRKASHSRSSDWRSFQTAVNCYQARPDYFDGIGYVFAHDDPYVGGDIDHSLDTSCVPPTYAEISPSGNGIKFIARASGDYGRKTAKGELYSRRRFFTITGNVLPGHEAITECQAEIEAFAASLSTPKALKDGTAGSGSRAELAAQIPEADWDDARHLLRVQINRLLARVRAAAKEETQLAYLLRGDYAAFHQKWAFVGLYRADGSLDDSMVRAVAAMGIRGRGFTFPEYVALMTHLYGAAAVAKWGTKQAWREELAALWFKSQAPRYAPKLTPKVKAPRGRAGDHAALVEKVYQLLLDHRAGAEAVVQIADLAAAVGANRRTIASILNELRKDHISTRRCGQYGGLIITFSDVIYSGMPPDELPAPARENDAPPLPTEETTDANCVSSDRAEADHISEPRTLPQAVELVLSQVDPKEFGRARLKTVRETLAVLYGYTDPNAVNREIKVQESIFGKERHDCWRMPPDALFVRIQARATSLARNIGKRQEGKYRKLAEIAREVCNRRGLKMPAKPTKEKPITPRRAVQRPIAPAVVQPDLFADAPPPSPYHAGFVNEMVARLKAQQVQR